MSRLIKSYDSAAGAISAHTLVPPREPAPVAKENVVSLEVLALRAEVESLAKRLDQGEAEKARLQSDVARALQEGEERGRKAGLKEGQEMRAAALERLEDGVDRALAAFSDALASLERLAPLLANEGLGRVLGSPAAYEDLLGQSIRTQIERLEAHALIRVQVSRADFPEAADLERLRAAVDRRAVELEAVEDLKPGDCRIRLALGQLEVGIAQQWGRLSALLHDLAETAVRP